MPDEFVWMVVADSDIERMRGKMEPTRGGATNDPVTQVSKRSGLPAYQKPNTRVMDEKEVLSAFQVTVAGISWWVG
jgi:hypothetical protein